MNDVLTNQRVREGMLGFYREEVREVPRGVETASITRAPVWRDQYVSDPSARTEILTACVTKSSADVDHDNEGNERESYENQTSNGPDATRVSFHPRNSKSAG